MNMELQYHVEGIFDASVPVDIKDGALIECDGLYDVFDFFYVSDDKAGSQTKCDELTDYQDFVSTLLAKATETIEANDNLTNIYVSKSAQYQWRNMRVTALLIT